MISNVVMLPEASVDMYALPGVVPTESRLFTRYTIELLLIFAVTVPVFSIVISEWTAYCGSPVSTKFSSECP